MKTIWITRARPAADATAERLRAMGFDPVVAPLLEVRPLGDGPIDLTGAAAIAFTSANGVEAFAGRSNARVLPVFTVGAATAAAARDAGFADVLSADGDVAALAGMIAARKDQIQGAVLHAGAADLAGDLTGALTAQGIAARRLVLYETVAIAQQRPKSVDAVLVHSPKAARLLADRLRGKPAPRLRILCLSPAVAAPLAGLGAIAIADSPDEDALLCLLASEMRPRVLSAGFWTAMIFCALCFIAAALVVIEAPRWQTHHSSVPALGGRAKDR